MGAWVTGVVELDEELVVLGAVVDFADELHAAVIDASATPTMKSERFGVMQSILVGPLPAAEHTLPLMTENRDTETVERVIPQPAEAIFAFLADPRRHQEIDGSGSVREAKSGPERMKLGDKFDVAMKFGVPYTTHNTVVEFEDNRRIAWTHRSEGPTGAVLGGAIWRYELEPVSGGTLVRETWDFSSTGIVKPLLRLGKSRKDSREGMEKTLENIEKLLAS